MRGLFVAGMVFDVLTTFAEPKPLVKTCGFRMDSDEERQKQRARTPSPSPGNTWSGSVVPKPPSPKANSLPAKKASPKQPRRKGIFSGRSHSNDSDEEVEKRIPMVPVPARGPRSYFPR